MASNKLPPVDPAKVAKPWDPQFTMKNVMATTNWTKAEYNAKRESLLNAMKETWARHDEIDADELATFVNTYIGRPSDDASWLYAFLAERDVDKKDRLEWHQAWWLRWAKYIKSSSHWSDNRRATRAETAKLKDAPPPVPRSKLIVKIPAIRSDNNDSVPRMGKSSRGGKSKYPESQQPAGSQEPADDANVIQSVEEPAKNEKHDDQLIRATSRQMSEISLRAAEVSPAYIQQWSNTRASIRRRPTPRVNWSFSFMEWNWQREGKLDKKVSIPLGKFKPDNTPNDCDHYLFEHQRFLNVVDNWCGAPGLSGQPDFHLWFHDTHQGQYLDLADPSGYHLALAAWCKQPHSEDDNLHVTSNYPLPRDAPPRKRNLSQLSTIDEDDDEEEDESIRPGHGRRKKAKLNDGDKDSDEEDADASSSETDDDPFIAESEIDESTAMEGILDDEERKKSISPRLASPELTAPYQETPNPGELDSTMIDIVDSVLPTTQAAAQNSAAQNSAAQNSAAQNSAAQNSAAQNSAAQGSTTEGSVPTDEVHTEPTVAKTRSIPRRDPDYLEKLWGSTPMDKIRSSIFTLKKVPIQGAVFAQPTDPPSTQHSTQPVIQPSIHFPPLAKHPAQPLPPSPDRFRKVVGPLRSPTPTLPPKIVSDHPTFGRIYSPEEQKAAVYPLPFEQQEELVREKYKELEDINDDDEVNRVCEFGKQLKEINVLKLEKFPIVNDDALMDDDDSEAGDDDRQDEDDEETDETGNGKDLAKGPLISVKRGAASTSRLLEHFTLENFRKFIKFFRLDVNELMLHSRTQFNFPSMPSRHPYLQQLFISVVLVEMLMDHGLAILGDEPGLGKTTVKELVYRIWLHLDNLRHEIYRDRKNVRKAEKAGEKYKRQHLPRDASDDEVCPTANDHIFQCPCQKNAVFTASRIKAFRGHRLDINQKAQIYNPGMKEAWAMHRGAADGIGASGPIKYKVYHPSEVKQAPADMIGKQWPQWQDFHQICPEYQALDDKDPDQPDRVGYDSEGVLDVEEMIGYNWRYAVNQNAKNITFSTTPHYVSSRTKGGAMYDLFGTTKHLGNHDITASRSVPQGGRKKPIIEYYAQDSDIVRRDPICAKPGLLCVDEWHNQRGHTNSVMEALVAEFAETWSSYEQIGQGEVSLIEDFEFFVSNIPFTRVLLMSGTPLTIGAPSAIDAAVQLIRMQIKAVNKATEHFKAQFPTLPKCVSAASLAECTKQVNKITNATRSQFKKTIMAVDQLGGVSNPTTLRQNVPKALQKEHKSQNTLAAKYLGLFMAQRGTSSRMFGQPFGIPIKIHQENITMTPTLQDNVNQFVIDKEDAVAREVRARRRAAKKDEVVNSAQVMTAMMLGDHSVRSAGALPGLKAARERWQASETARLNNLLRDKQVNTVVKWPEELKGKAWSELNAEDKKLATTITFYNTEFEVRGMGTLWPKPPHVFFRTHYKTLLAIRDNSTRPQALTAGDTCQTKAEKFYLWVKKIWGSVNRDGKDECGFLASLSIFELETYRAFAMMEFANRKSPWYIADHIDREFFGVYTDNWKNIRSIAVDYVLGDDAFTFAEKWLHEKKYKLKENYPWLLEDDWKNFTRRPRFLMGSGILAEGISATRFDDLAMLEPFFQKAKITQMACRPQRINSTWAKRIAIWCLSGGLYDVLAIGIYKGPKTATEGAKKIQQSFGQLTQEALRDEEEKQVEGDEEEEEDDDDDII